MDVASITGDIADRLMVSLNNVIDTSIRARPRVDAARSVLIAVALVDPQLRAVVDRVQAYIQADGVMVVIMDEDEAHMVMVDGADVVRTELRDIPTAPGADSYCKYSVTMSIPFTVEDARLEPVLKGNRWVEQVRGYIGGTLVVSDFPVGALCALSDAPRRWSFEESRLIHAAADEVSAILEKALLGRTTNDKTPPPGKGGGVESEITED